MPCFPPGLSTRSKVYRDSLEDTELYRPTRVARAVWGFWIRLADLIKSIVILFETLMAIMQSIVRNC